MKLGDADKQVSSFSNSNLLRDNVIDGENKYSGEEENEGGSGSESEVEIGSSDGGVDEDDDDLFNDNIDIDAEWVGNNQIKNNIEDKVEQDEFGDDDILESEDDFDSAKDSDSDTEGKSFPVFNSFEIYDPTFELGMLFNNKKEFRKAVHSCAIKSKRNVKITKNDKIRIYGKCADANCGWKIHATKVKNEETFQVREYVSHHTCAPKFHVKNVKSSWLCEKYVHKFKFDPKRKVKGFRLDMMKELRCNITHYQAYRAKSLALEMLEGNVVEQYSLLWSYADEIKRTNPGSTVVIGTDQSSGENIFDRMYVFLYALKMGFVNGCRPLVGVDGCHLKGPNAGVLLTAVGLDPNNNIYPLAFAVVSKENRDTWEWFLTLFKSDMHIESDYGWTFMSDKQKGLIQAFHEVFPNVEHRFCVRHMYSNFKNAGFRGQAFKSIVWRAARATTANEFKRAMSEMGIIDIKAVEWFNDKPPHQWSRSYFSCHSRTNILLNNLCETFNSNILEAREMPILSMMEWIMEYLMKRLQLNRDRAQRKWKGTVCPRIQKIVNKNIEFVADCIPIKADDKHYQISCFDGSQYVVDLEQMICGCRKWDLTGIPCKHALSAILNQGWRVEDYIHKCYSVETYNKVYESAIMPINGRKEWKDSNFVPPLPPNYGRSAGRPKKARRREADEIQQKAKKKQKYKSMAHQKNQSRLKRQQLTLRCSNCGVEGHNKRACILQKTSEDCSQDTTRQVPAQRVHKLHVRRKNTVDNLVGMTSTQKLGQSKVGETNFSYSAFGSSSFPLKSQFYEKGVQVSSSSTTLPPTMYEQFQQSRRVNEDIV